MAFLKEDKSAKTVGTTYRMFRNYCHSRNISEQEGMRGALDMAVVEKGRVISREWLTPLEVRSMRREILEKRFDYDYRGLASLMTRASSVCRANVLWNEYNNKYAQDERAK